MLQNYNLGEELEMKKQIIILFILILFLSVFFSGCEEELKTLCDKTKATPIVVELYIKLEFTIEIKNFEPVEGDKWWYLKHINKCGETKPIDQTIEEQDASEIPTWIAHTFPKVSVYVDNELDEVFIEGGLISKDGNFYTRKYLSYNQVKPYMGGIYNVTLGLGEVSDTADITISADVYKTINNNEVPIDGETIKFDISSSMGHTGTYYKTTDRTGATDPFWITFTYTKKFILSLVI